MKVFSGWKEIANHMRQGERTVKCWEQFGLPIHRVGELQKGPVFAFVEAVEKWEKTTGTRNVIQKLQNRVKSLEAEVRLLKRENRKLKRNPRAEARAHH